MAKFVCVNVNSFDPLFKIWLIVKISCIVIDFQLNLCLDWKIHDGIFT